MKFNSENVKNTVSAMCKTYKLLSEKKLMNSKRSITYCYDFSLLESSNIPMDIMNQVKTSAITESSLMTDCVMVDCKSLENGKQYYVTLDFTCYNVVSDSKNKTVYRIMECTGIRVSAYNLNIYGYVSERDMPSETYTIGVIRTSIANGAIELKIA